ncbi:MAG: hypothetical protein ACOVKC_09700 [Brevundimonas sp.]
MNVRSSLLSTVAVLGILLGAGGAAAQSAAPPAAQEIRADGRTTLSAGLADAGQLASGIALEHAIGKPPGFVDPDIGFSPPTSREEGEAMMARARGNPNFSVLGMANTDMAVSDGKLFVGNFNEVCADNTSDWVLGGFL